MTRHAAVDFAGELRVPGDDTPWRILSWSPPRLLLGRGEEVRAFFLAPAPGGVWIGAGGHVRLLELRPRRAAAAAGAPGHDDLSAPMPGKVLEVLVEEGQGVEVGQRLLIIEAMKMETPIRAPHESTVSRIHVREGESVSPGDLLIELEAGS
ncbi:MAG: acetyl-CoA carboxylase biotin carboxyl carrier protein subunit [Planctomycetota bacterium]